MSIDDKSTRGKTRPGRLALVDEWVNLWLEDGGVASTVVDFGAGEHGWTTLDWLDSMERLGTRPHAVAIENDVRRAQNLREDLRDQAQVVLGGLEFDLDTPVCILRAMNVFRQYAVEDAQAGYDVLRRRLRPGGALLVGTTDKSGEIATFWHIDSDGNRQLIVGTTGARGFAPRQFRDFLPRDIRRNSVDSNPFLQFLPKWEEAWRETRVGDPLADFGNSIRVVDDPTTILTLSPRLAALNLG